MKKVFVLLFSIIGLYAQVKDSITLKEVVITGEFAPVPKSASVYQTITIKPQEVNNLGANTLSPKRNRTREYCHEFSWQDVIHKIAYFRLPVELMC